MLMRRSTAERLCAERTRELRAVNARLRRELVHALTSQVAVSAEQAEWTAAVLASDPATRQERSAVA